LYLHLFAALALAGALAACGGSPERSPDLIGATAGDPVGGPSIAGGAGAPSIAGGAGGPSINGGAASGPSATNSGGNGGNGGPASGGTFCAAGSNQSGQACSCILNGTQAQLDAAIGENSASYTQVATCNSSDYPCCFSVSSGVCACTSLENGVTCDEFLQAASLTGASSCP
jgi:hypothetical protein